MDRPKFQNVLAEIAQQYNTTADEVRCQMQLAMDDTRKTSDPVAKALWDSIPHQGDDLTLEEFVAYLANHSC